MEVTREDINFDPRIRQFVSVIAVKIAEYNPLMTKAKAEFVSSVIDAIFPIIEAKQAEFEEIYGLEIIKNAHHVPENMDKDEYIPITTKFVSSREVQQKLLDSL